MAAAGDGAASVSGVRSAVAGPLRAAASVRPPPHCAPADQVLQLAHQTPFATHTHTHTHVNVVVGRAPGAPHEAGPRVARAHEHALGLQVVDGLKHLVLQAQRHLHAVALVGGQQGLQAGRRDRVLVAGLGREGVGRALGGGHRDLPLAFCGRQLGVGCWRLRCVCGGGGGGGGRRNARQCQVCAQARGHRAEAAARTALAALLAALLWCGLAAVHCIASHRCQATPGSSAQQRNQHHQPPRATAAATAPGRTEATKLTCWLHVVKGCDAGDAQACCEREPERTALLRHADGGARAPEFEDSSTSRGAVLKLELGAAVRANADGYSNGECVCCEGRARYASNGGHAQKRVGAHQKGSSAHPSEESTCWMRACCRVSEVLSGYHVGLLSDGCAAGASGPAEARPRKAGPMDDRAECVRANTRRWAGDACAPVFYITTAASRACPLPTWCGFFPSHCDGHGGRHRSVVGTHHSIRRSQVTPVKPNLQPSTEAGAASCLLAQLALLPAVYTRTQPTAPSVQQPQQRARAAHHNPVMMLAAAALLLPPHKSAANTQPTHSSASTPPPPRTSRCVAAGGDAVLAAKVGVPHLRACKQQTAGQGHVSCTRAHASGRRHTQHKARRGAHTCTHTLTNNPGPQRAPCGTSPPCRCAGTCVSQRSRAAPACV
jgi:hypothetical protein